MSSRTVLVACGIGAAAFAVIVASARSSRTDKPAEILLLAKFTFSAAAVFAFIAFAFGGLLYNAAPMEVLLAELPSRQARKLVYLAYGCFTAAVLAIATWLWRRGGPNGNGV